MDAAARMTPALPFKTFPGTAPCWWKDIAGTSASALCPPHHTGSCPSSLQPQRSWVDEIFKKMEVKEPGSPLGLNHSAPLQERWGVGSSPGQEP